MICFLCCTMFFYFTVESNCNCLYDRLYINKDLLPKQLILVIIYNIQYSLNVENYIGLDCIVEL